MRVVANGQEVLEGSRSTALTGQATAQATTYFSASEIHMLREQELQYDYASLLSVYEYVRNNPSAREQKCLVTQCVPARRDGHHFASWVLILIADSFTRPSTKHQRVLTRKHLLVLSCIVVRYFRVFCMIAFFVTMLPRFVALVRLRPCSTSQRS
jgi:hypothetical protein